ncbi:hypothetical protein FQA39_LY15745 [Lamprigera yunnana]|nr:hypothetical protein FQA39_LY15745 [Lamprigera yunnana]
MGWSQEHVQSLIECYRANECLYMVTSPRYKNKHARSAALEQIVKCLKSLGRNCTIADIKSKWNGPRTNYLSECRKYESTQKSGAGADDEIDNGNGEVVIEYMDESDIENHNLSFSPPATPIFVTDNNGPSTSTSSLKAKRICSSENASPTHSVRRSKNVYREDKIVEEQTLTLTAIRTAIEQKKTYRLNSITDDDIRTTAEEEITEVLFRNYKIFRNKYHNVQ